MNKTLLALYGLKWNPFSPELPIEALHVTSQVENFCWRVEHGLVREGGFALITGEPGTGKSAVMRLLAHRLGKLRDLSVGAITHPSSNLADFYREMGDLFGVELKPHNRWGGFKSLRERWLSHLDGTLMRPVLLIDEAQEMHPAVLGELRLLSSTQFDSRNLLSVVFAGDGRFNTKLRRDELLPLGSRIRTRLLMEYASREELASTLCDHAIGNYRVLTGMANELLATAAQRELPLLDEKLFLECYGSNTAKPRKSG
jgi:general secretion pathway protein A